MSGVARDPALSVQVHDLSRSTGGGEKPPA
jgi:hypothetical protein